MSAIKSITITIDLDGLPNVSDEFLALYWHVAQANPVDSYSDREPELIAEHVGREIIRRWLKDQPPSLWNVKGGDYLFGKHVLPATEVQP